MYIYLKDTEESIECQNCSFHKYLSIVNNFSVYDLEIVVMQKDYWFLQTSDIFENQLNLIYFTVHTNFPIFHH